MCAVFLVFVHFLTLTPLSHAQNTNQPSPIDGLRFDTPIPESYGKKLNSIYFLSSYDIKKNNILTVKKSIPTPLSITSTTSSSIGELLIPTVTAQEAIPSVLVANTELTESAKITKTPVEELLTASTPSPTALAQAKKVSDAIPKPKSTVEPTTKPTQKPTASPSTKPTESSSPTPVPTSIPSSSSELNTGGLNADKIFELVNNYRSSKSLPPVQKDDRVCEVARSRAPEVGAEISGGYMHKGIRARNLPYFNSEIIISMRSEEAAVNWWISDYIHRVQMEGDYKYSCAACSGNSCVQEFTNFLPKG